MSEQSPSPPVPYRRRNGRPIRVGGGPPHYLDNALAAAAEPLRGITTDGNPITGLFRLEKTGVSTQPIRRAAEAFLGSLSDPQKEKAIFPIGTVEWRKWSNIHRTIMRHGMPLFEMTDAQLERAFGLIEASLSPQGFETARDVMRLNETVMELTGKLDEFGEDLYWLSIMGNPSLGEPWGWQLDGHHLNLNYFILGDQVVLAPAFLGSEPVWARSGKYAGTRVFAAEQELGLAVIRGLDDAQSRKAIVSADLPRDLFATASRDNLELPYEGIRYDELSKPQHELLLRLAEVHVGRLRAEHARLKMAEVKSHLRDIHFSWRGGRDDDSVFYYRIHSPVLLIEFDHQAGQAFPEYREHYKDHIHVVVRTPNGNDYGADLLRQHYRQSPHHTHPD